MIRHLVGARGFAHCTTDRVLVTDEGMAFLAQLVAPAVAQSAIGTATDAASSPSSARPSLQQQGETHG